MMVIRSFNPFLSLALVTDTMAFGFSKKHCVQQQYFLKFRGLIDHLT